MRSQHAGISLKHIQEISGHNDLGTLQRYLEVSPEQMPLDEYLFVCYTNANNNIYPNLPAIAAHFQVSVISIVKYEVWSNCFFVKIVGIGYRFVSKSFTRRVVKAATQKPKPQPQPSLYRVVKTWDNGSSWYGERVISVLVQPVDNSEKPYWESVFLQQGIQRGDILREGSGRRLVKANMDYAQAIGLY